MKPLAYARKWHADGEVPAKERNANGRMAWPKRFTFLPVTPGKVSVNDVALVPLEAAERLAAVLEKVANATNDTFRLVGSPLQREAADAVAQFKGEEA